MARPKREYKAGPGLSIILVLIWLVGLVEVTKWVIEGLF